MHRTWLLGLIHGHFDSVWRDDMSSPLERMNEGMACVTPDEYIEDVLHQAAFMEARGPIEEKMREEAAATMDGA